MQNRQSQEKVDERARKPGKPSAAGAIVAITRDPAEFELALQPWELLCLPQTAGVFLHRITALRSSEFILYRERFSLPVHLQGLSPDGMLAFSVPLGYENDPLY